MLSSDLEETTFATMQKMSEMMTLLPAVLGRHLLAHPLDPGPGVGPGHGAAHLLLPLHALGVGAAVGAETGGYHAQYEGHF